MMTVLTVFPGYPRRQGMCRFYRHPRHHRHTRAEAAGHWRYGGSRSGCPGAPDRWGKIQPVCGSAGWVARRGCRRRPAVRWQCPASTSAAEQTRPPPTRRRARPCGPVPRRSPPAPAPSDSPPSAGPGRGSPCPGRSRAAGRSGSSAGDAAPSWCPPRPSGPPSRKCHQRGRRSGPCAGGAPAGCRCCAGRPGISRRSYPGSRRRRRCRWYRRYAPFAGCR